MAGDVNGGTGWGFPLRREDPVGVRIIRGLVPLIDRFLPAPRALPPPVTAAAIRECVAFPARRDPYGDAVHTTLGCAYLAGAGLSTAVEGILFALLVGYALLRAPNLFRGWAPLLASPVPWLLAAWFVWVLVAGAWTPDRAAWLDHVADRRALLVLPALYPIRRHWQLLLGALLVGMSFQGVIQSLQALGFAPMPEAKNALRPSGFNSHPVHVSIFHAVAACIALGWLVETRSARTRGLLVLAMAFSIAGIGIAAGRAAILGLAIALPTLALLLMVGRHVSRKTILRGAVAALAIGAIAGAIVLAGGAAGLRRQASDVNVAATTDATTSTGQRALWWRAAIRAFSAAPIVGAGPGSARTFIAADPDVRNAIERHPDRPADFFVPAHPHSAYLQTLAETGLVGGAIMLGLWLAVGIAAWRSARETPIRCGVAAGLVVWAVAAGFDAIHHAGRTAALACALVAFVGIPRRHPAEPPNTTRTD